MPASVQNDAAVHQNIVEKEEVLHLGLPPVLLSQAALADQEPARLGQRSPRGTKWILHHRDSLQVLLQESELIHVCICSTDERPRRFIPVWAVRERTFHSESGDKHVEQEVKKTELYLECRCMEFYLKGRVEKRWEFTSESLIKDFQIKLDWILVKKKTKLGLCQCQDVQGKLKKDY